MQCGRSACSVNRPYRLPVVAIITSLNSKQFVVCFHCSTPIQYYGLHSTNAGEGQQLNGKNNTGTTKRVIGRYCGSVYITGCCESSATKVNSCTQNDRAV